MSRLKDLYKDEIVEAMIKKFGYKNVMEVPKLDKIVINMGVGAVSYTHLVGCRFLTFRRPAPSPWR